MTCADPDGAGVGEVLARGAVAGLVVAGAVAVGANVALARGETVAAGELLPPPQATASATTTSAAQAKCARSETSICPAGYQLHRADAAFFR